MCGRFGALAIALRHGIPFAIAQFPLVDNPLLFSGLAEDKNLVRVSIRGMEVIDVNHTLVGHTELPVTAELPVRHSK